MGQIFISFLLKKNILNWMVKKVIVQKIEGPLRVTMLLIAKLYMI